MRLFWRKPAPAPVPSPGVEEILSMDEQDMLEAIERGAVTYADLIAAQAALHKKATDPRET